MCNTISSQMIKTICNLCLIKFTEACKKHFAMSKGKSIYVLAFYHFNIGTTRLSNTSINKTVSQQCVGAVVVMLQMYKLIYHQHHHKSISDHSKRHSIWTSHKRDHHHHFAILRRVENYFIKSTNVMAIYRTYNTYFEMSFHFR